MFEIQKFGGVASIAWLLYFECQVIIKALDGTYN